MYSIWMDGWTDQIQGKRQLAKVEHTQTFPSTLEHVMPRSGSRITLAIAAVRSSQQS